MPSPLHVPQVRALQRRLYELGHGPEGEDSSTHAGGVASFLPRRAAGACVEEGSGDVCMEEDMHRLLTHNRKVAEEMRQYGQVR